MQPVEKILGWKKWKLEICGRRKKNQVFRGNKRSTVSFCQWRWNWLLGGRSKPACSLFVVSRMELRGEVFPVMVVVVSVAGCLSVTPEELQLPQRELNAETQVQGIKWYRRVAAVQNGLLWNGCENNLMVCPGGYWAADAVVQFKLVCLLTAWSVVRDEGRFPAVRNITAGKVS